MKRRGFLIGGVSLVAAAALGFFAMEIASEWEVAHGVRKKLPWLKLDDAGVREFAKAHVAELLAKRPTWYRWKYHFHQLFVHPAARWGISTDTRSRRDRLEDNFATIYLLSSDFFVNGSDESRLVKYVALYDPMRACGSPFARRPSDPEATV
jgi:hypothetical protein